MEESAQPATPKINARRQLIRGAFSVPAVATIYSGNAFAVASNMRCVVNQTTDSALRTAAAPGPTGDGFVRVPVYRITTVPGNVVTEYVKGSDLIAKRGTNPAVLVLANGGAATGANDWIQLNGTYFVNVTTPIATYTPQLVSGKTAAIRVANDGNIVGIVQNGWDTTTMPANTSAVKGTCWNSFSGLAIT